MRDRTVIRALAATAVAAAIAAGAAAAAIVLRAGQDAPDYR